MFGAFNTSNTFGWMICENVPFPYSVPPTGPEPQLIHIRAGEDISCCCGVEVHRGIICPQTDVHSMNGTYQPGEHITVRLVHAALQLLDQDGDARVRAEGIVGDVFGQVVGVDPARPAIWILDLHPGRVRPRWQSVPFSSR